MKPRKTCQCRGCGETRLDRGRGVCALCRSHAQRRGDLDELYPIARKPPRPPQRKVPTGRTSTCPRCDIEAPHYSEGLCSRCYDKGRKNSPRIGAPQPVNLAVLAELISAPDDPDWRRQAACASSDPEDWFAEIGDRYPATAIQICEACPVRVLCLREALQANITYGLWGGQTPRQRRAIRNRLGGKTISA